MIVGYITMFYPISGKVYSQNLSYNFSTDICCCELLEIIKVDKYTISSLDFRRNFEKCSCLASIASIGNSKLRNNVAA